MGWGGMIGMILFWVVLVAAIVWAVSRLLPGRQAPSSPSASGQEKPEDILARRYARGEIDLETYQAQRDVLASGRNERLR
jgi:putative membrane protein